MLWLRQGRRLFSLAGGDRRPLLSGGGGKAGRRGRGGTAQMVAGGRGAGTEEKDALRCRGTGGQILRGPAVRARGQAGARLSERPRTGRCRRQTVPARVCAIRK